MVERLVMDVQKEMNQVNYSHLFTKSKLQQQIKDWLDEDIPSFDYGGAVVGDVEEVAFLLGKQRGVFSGTPFFNEIFELLDCRVKWNIKDGEEFNPVNGPVVLAEVRGAVRNILMGERLSLNILSRSCGITTRAFDLRAIVDGVKWHGKVAGTRKTTPGFRLVEKYAMLVGGCDCHRMDLSSMIMLKDNHVWSAGGNITAAVKKARSIGGFSLEVEVECRTEDEAVEAVEAGADVVMLDNMLPPMLAVVSKSLKTKYPHIVIEASGGVIPETLASYALPTVDIISMGSLCQSVPHIDISLKIQKRK
ncbi:nicotinate-nucleotide diphosphorylase [Heterostelium album PN500]|uniref:Nicotinate-nucleotide pyrophosphorylase [carboxylating] n=1 Tax=Heterostelium pallidum (strain ATCC 26659 / Pp 5 / PN500) TaxID=670386 RepID=D3BIB6_HETP5|nr:nicotinate-nucleotide diphosphorylase [Heterostelium album PN500]EFA79016.1 nicotinate-nucleotide diphosphorylase [Heterostelium album PN500]|eukprot:XP_020431139.1 nicotinate-nucleotide diphosphorylase [Heterostelium album PN500]